MTDDLFDSNQQFLDLFDIKDSQDYYDPILFTDTKYGFSVKRNYPNNIKYKPAIKNNGQPDNVAVMWIALDEGKQFKDGKILLTVRISNYSLWANPYIADNNPESPTKESLEASNRTPKPASLEYPNHFYYDPSKKDFIDAKNKRVNTEQILDFVFQEHCYTVHLLKGMELRVKQNTRKLCNSLILVIIWILKLILEKIFQNKLILKRPHLEKMPLSLTMNPFTGIQRREGEQSKLDEVIGYKAYQSTIVVFSALVTFFTILNYNGILNLKYYHDILKNDNFLLLVHSIIALVIIDSLPGYILFPLLNMLVILRTRIMFISINPFTYKKWLLPAIYCVILCSLIYCA